MFSSSNEYIIDTLMIILLKITPVKWKKPIVTETRNVIYLVREPLYVGPFRTLTLPSSSHLRHHNWEQLGVQQWRFMDQISGTALTLRSLDQAWRLCCVSLPFVQCDNFTLHCYIYSCILFLFLGCFILYPLGSLMTAFNCIEMYFVVCFLCTLS